MGYTIVNQAKDKEGKEVSIWWRDKGWFSPVLPYGHHNYQDSDHDAELVIYYTDASNTWRTLVFCVVPKDGGCVVVRGAFDYSIRASKSESECATINRTAIRNSSMTARLYGTASTHPQQPDPRATWCQDPGETRYYGSSGSYYYFYSKADTPGTTQSAFWRGRIGDGDDVDVDPEKKLVTITHRSITQADLDDFKKLFPNDKKVQAVTLENLIKQSKGKFHDGSSAVASGKPPSHPARAVFSECEWATAGLVVDAFCLVTGAVGIRAKVSPSWMGKVAEALDLNAIEELVKKSNTPNNTLTQKAKMVWEIVSLVKNGGNLEAVWKAIVGGLKWWDMVFYGVLGTAEVTAAFATDGVALIALIVAELATVGFFASDLDKFVKACENT